MFVLGAAEGADLVPASEHADKPTTATIDMPAAAMCE
ncbi:hypothetical protein MMUC44124_00370 [Mycolicibacterium mucogenicum DSM 44124]|nr:hypothetical protein MMUC44124_00370 [Mycolicibacterium mucogenicum DSM 44124]